MEENIESVAPKSTTSNVVHSAPTKSRLNVALIFGLILAAALIAIFYGTSTYKTSTEHAVELTEGRAKQFQVVAEELLRARYRSMGIAADTLLQSKVTINPFMKRDRAALEAVIDPYFRYVKDKHGVLQINFWIPKAILFYRAGSPELGQMDASKFRNTVVSANERQERIMAVETGQGGVVGIRGIVPVLDGEKFYGLVEYVSDFHIPLNGAAGESHMKWGLSISKEKFEQTERPRNDAEDAVKDNDIYIEYLDSGTRDIIKNVNFDPRSKEHGVYVFDGRHIFIKTFPIYNYVGKPTITIAMVDDISQEYALAFQKALIHGGVLFLILSAILVFGYLKIDNLRSGILGSIGAEKRLLKERLAQGDEAISKLRDVEIVKRRFFANLMNAINRPLLAITGQLETLRQELSDKGLLTDKALEERFTYTTKEAQYVQRLVSDYEQIEVFRHDLVNTDLTPISLKGAIEESLVNIERYRRLPNLSINLNLAETLPFIRGNVDLLAKAIDGLMGYTIHIAGQGDINISTMRDENWAVLSISGPALAGPDAPNEALLNEVQQFLAELSKGITPTGNAEKLIGLLLARVTIESFGGNLQVASTGEPGFIARFPLAD